MIKVLMLGWEFPPHISGGLGVACEGLTSALIKTDEVLIHFVIPRAPEVEKPNLTVQGANTIGVRKRHQRNTRQTVRTTSTRVNEIATEQSLLEVTTVESPLTPYEQPVQSQQEFLTKWNASISGTQDHHHHISETSDIQFGDHVTLHSFEGGYGSKLFHEVDKYAEVVSSFSLQSDFDIIHAHDWMTFPAAIAIKQATGKPLTIHVHATEFDRAGTGGSDVVYEMEKMAVKSADKIIAVSVLTRKTLVERYGADPDKVAVVYNGMKFKKNLPLSNESHPLGDQLVSFVGRITFQKGPEYFIDAAEKVLKEFPGCHFVMAGAGDAMPAMIKRVIAKRLSDRFHFTGFLNRNDVARLLSFTRVYVMPSVSEPFGLTALEAVNAGVPVVISLQSGVSEVLPDAIKVDFWDTDALAQAICGVLRYPLLSETMRQRALNSVSSISWDAAASKVLNLYNELLKHDGAAHSQSNP